MLNPTPLVSAVIPTYRRAALAPRAVRSALGQTLRDLEVIVIVDDNDEASARALSQIDDSRLKVVVSQTHLGNAEARNAGVAEARCPWIAFLDDDDEWLPRKLERQLQTAAGSSRRHPIVACRLIARNDSSEFVWPRRIPAPGEALSEYLFCRRTLFSGEGVLPTTTIFTSRALLQEVPFRRGLEKHVDPDWLFRAAAREDVGVEFVTDPEPLAVWNIEEQRSRISNSLGWRYSVDWIRESRDLVTKRAYASFVLTLASASAARARDWKAFPVLLAEAYRHGTPSFVDLGVHMANFFVPDVFHRWFAGTSPSRQMQPSAEEAEAQWRS